MFAKSELCKFAFVQSRDEHPRTRSPDRPCGSCVVFVLLNYCPALHALNRVKKKKGERDLRALFSPELSLGRSHESCTRAANRRRKCDRNYRNQPLTIAIVITRNRTLAVQKAYNIDQVLIPASEARRRSNSSNLMRKRHTTPRMKIGSRATNGKFRLLERGLVGLRLIVAFVKRAYDNPRKVRMRQRGFKPIYFYISRASDKRTWSLRFVRTPVNCYTGCCKTCRMRWVKVTDPRKALFNILSRVRCYEGKKKKDTTTCPAERRDLKDSKIARPLVRNELQRSTVSQNVSVIRYIRDRIQCKPLLLYSAFQFIEPYYCVDTHISVYYIRARIISVYPILDFTITWFFLIKLERTCFE